MNDMIILLDIDHTISNSFWRDSMIGHSEWDAYHEASKHDRPFPNVVRLINSLANVGYWIVSVTGRTEKFRSLTLNWFLENRIHIDEILMRPDDVFFKNAEMKIHLIRTRFGGKYNEIHFAIEDNEDACLEYQKLGITTLQIRNIGG